MPGQSGSLLTWRWLFTSSFVRPSTCITSLICFGVATAITMKFVTLSLAASRKQMIKDDHVLCLLCTLRAAELMQSGDELPVKLRRPAPPRLPASLLLSLRVQGDPRRARWWHGGTKSAAGVIAGSHGRNRGLRCRRYQRQTSAGRAVFSPEERRRQGWYSRNGPYGHGCATEQLGLRRGDFTLMLLIRL